MKMLIAFAALFGSSTLVVFAQAADPTTTVPYAKEGALAVALGALVWALQHLLRTYLPEQQKQFTATLDNIVARDEQHHKDRLEESSQLKDAIGELRDNCRDFQRTPCPKQGTTP